jgi:hypothetical protein
MILWLMTDNVKTVLGMCRDLSDGMAGIDVVDSGPGHLELTRPDIVAYLHPISDHDTTNISTAPGIFNPRIDLTNDNKNPVFPWLSNRQCQLATYESNPDNPVTVSFVSGAYPGQRANELSEQGIPADQRLIIPLSDKVGEAIFHRLTSYYLARDGWLVASEHQYPINNDTVSADSPGSSRGVPDIVAWKSPFLQTLREKGLVQNGATLHELAFLSAQNTLKSLKKAEQQSVGDTKTLVAEVKGSDRSPGELDQVNKYIKDGYYDVAFGVMPQYPNRTDPPRGFITCDESGFKMISDPIEDETGRRTSHAREDERDWFVNLMDGIAAQTLLCNLDYNAIVSIAGQSEEWTPQQPYDLVQNLWETPHGEVASEVATSLSK